MMRTFPAGGLWRLARARSSSPTCRAGRPSRGCPSRCIRKRLHADTAVATGGRGPGASANCYNEHWRQGGGFPLFQRSGRTRIGAAHLVVARGPGRPQFRKFQRSAARRFWCRIPHALDHDQAANAAGARWQRAAPLVKIKQSDLSIQPRFPSMIAKRCLERSRRLWLRRPPRPQADRENPTPRACLPIWQSYCHGGRQ
jgi:hypothetical protein